MSERNSERKVVEAENPDPVTPKPAKKRDGDIPNVVEFKSWDSHKVNTFLEMHGLEDVATKFKEHNVKGSNLPGIDKNTLEVYGISDQETVDKVLMYIKMFKPSTSQVQSNQSPAPLYKVFNDSVHGHIEVHPLLVKIIDTPQFQRLRNIKQLGGCYYVYPGAAHNRFEHCIGTSHLAGQLASSLKKTHEHDPEIRISEEDVLCVSVAGLCHDLGHGPFSHMFGAKFIKEVKPETNWKHEEASVAMFDHLVEVNDLKDKFSEYNLYETDLKFIKELIHGIGEDTNHENWPYHGRLKSKSYLYEIVANKRTGIDVDKWDYFARDCHNLGIKNSFDHKRYIKMARVVKVDDGHQICVRDKEAFNIYGMFYTRYSLHRQAYQHKMSNAIEMMLCEAFVKADPYLKIEGKDGAEKKMSEAIHDMVAYTKLSDNVYYQILYSSDPNLQSAKEILQRIERRELYKYIGATILKQRRDKEDIPVICREITEKVPDIADDNIVVDLVTFDYGKKDKNPLENMRFYTKENPNQPLPSRKADEVSGLLPEAFREQHLRVYCRSRDKDIIEKAKTGFQKWCKEHKCYTVW